MSIYIQEEKNIDSMIMKSIAILMSVLTSIAALISRLSLQSNRHSNRRSTNRRSTFQPQMSLKDISGNFDSFIIDQWGVLHDGKHPYDGAIECLDNLNQEGKRLILLSNSSKRKLSSFKGLQKVGIDPNIFTDIITSGELGHQLLSGPRLSEIFTGSPLRTLTKVFVIGNGDDDIEYITTANCELCDPEEAHFVLARGTFSIVGNVDSRLSFSVAEDLMSNIDPWLDRCRRHNLPMLVTNPDFYRPGSGSPMPGQIGERYARMGGRVEYIGKPYSVVYDECFRVLSNLAVPSTQSSTSVTPSASSVCGKLESPVDTAAPAASDNITEIKLDKSRICGVGDSLDHDILGAEQNGIPSVWTANGVHCKEMGIEVEGSAESATDDVLEKMYSKYDIRPTYTVPSFRW